MHILKLIRYKNIIFIVVTQLLIYYSIIVPTLGCFAISSALTPLHITLLILSTALIAAGGYVVNDYFDIKIDRINHPDEIVITKSIEKPTAMRIYQILTVLGLMIGIAASAMLKNLTLGLSYILVPGLLWFYSSSYKRQLIVGNLIVSVLAAFVPLIILIAEAGALTTYYTPQLLQQTPVLSQLYSYICGISLAAFMFTFIREIIKDMEDEFGDREMECHTVPIVWGEKWAKTIVTALLIITNIALAFCAFSLIPFEGTLTIRYFIFGIAVPSIFLLIILWSNSCTAYKNASKLAKFIMAAGILYSIVYYYLMAKTYGIPFFGMFQII